MRLYTVAAAAHRASTRLLRVLMPGGRSLWPMAIFWEPTGRCNQRCKVCCFHGEHGHGYAETGELSPEDLGRIADRLIAASRRWPWRPVVVLSGGEPLLHPGTLSLAKRLREGGFRFAVLTNLMGIPDDALGQLLASGPEEIRVSIDGPREIHDRARRLEGAFEGTLDSLRRLLAMRNGRPVRVTLNCVLSRDTVDHLAEVAALAASCGVRMNIQHLNFLDAELAGAQLVESRRLLGEPLRARSHVDRFTPEEGRQFQAAAGALIAEADRAGVPLSFLPPIPLREVGRYYSDLEGYAYAGLCAAPWSIVRIDPLGNVYPCFEQRWGNLLTEDLGSIWNGPAARRFRAIIRAEKLLPGCRRCPKLCRWKARPR